MKNRILLVLPLLLGCESLVFDEDLASRDPKKNFDYLWSECDRKYAYFELKEVDWEQVYEEHSAKLYDGMSDDSLFQVLGGMLRLLRDDHANLVSNFNVSFYGVERFGPDNFEERIIKDHYLPANYYISGPFGHDYIEGTNKQVGYIRFPSFTGEINKENMGFVLERYADTRGLIIDLRENGGGSVSDVFALLSYFIDEKTLVYYSRLKNGPGHNDFSDPEPAYAEPAEGTRYTKKVMVLTDRGTYSAGSFFAVATKAIPNITLVGDTTGGGLGIPNGGQLPNGWVYRFSISQTLDLALQNTYENGVPPDIFVQLDLNDRTKDEVIERAIEAILSEE